MRRIVCLVPMLCAVVNLAAAPIESKILFARDTIVPRSVQQFAWRVIETRCNFSGFELEGRLFWAYDARAMRVDAAVVYSIKIF